MPCAVGDFSSKLLYFLTWMRRAAGLVVCGACWCRWSWKCLPCQCQSLDLLLMILNGNWWCNYIIIFLKNKTKYSWKISFIKSQFSWGLCFEDNDPRQLLKMRITWTYSKKTIKELLVTVELVFSLESILYLWKFCKTSKI